MFKAYRAKKQKSLIPTAIQKLFITAKERIKNRKESRKKFSSAVGDFSTEIKEKRAYLENDQALVVIEEDNDEYDGSFKKK